jgi:hypothetical protein
MYRGFHVKCRLFLSDLNKTRVLGKDFRKLLRYQVSWKSAQWEPSCSMRTDRQIWRSQYWLLAIFRTSLKTYRAAATYAHIFQFSEICPNKTITLHWFIKHRHFRTFEYITVLTKTIPMASVLDTVHDQSLKRHCFPHGFTSVELTYIIFKNSVPNYLLYQDKSIWFDIKCRLFPTSDWQFYLEVRHTTVHRIHQ